MIGGNNLSRPQLAANSNLGWRTYRFTANEDVAKFLLLTQIGLPPRANVR